ncbi:SET6 [Candida jiufengensis]|uniref:SET6 n=1 Tax=Candida jiufengensis TaxID=497108 RepID=UPI0022253362|nr:SET6 [Candida jiufengensis]KAI5953354.1 SET6 [Candida jiufengensis]
MDEIKIEKLSIEDDDIDTILNGLSKYFTIGETKYGGRGCFATSSIPKGTKIHYCSKPVGSTITKPFKKEVCNYCFKYDNGQIMKSKISSSSGKESIYFCSDECITNFLNQDDDNNKILLQNLLAVERNYLLGLKKPEDELKEPQGDLNEQIKLEWEKVDKWNKELTLLKETQKLQKIPRIDESEYLEIKYVVHVLFNMYKYKSSPQQDPMKLEMILFDILQSTEIEKYHKYPYLLYSYINMYKFIKLTCTKELKPYITPTTVRSIIGKNLSNAFGIWSHTLTQNEDKEFLGFAVYPSASFFNHSCSPNILKIRNKQDIRFETTREILPNEELCISYGNFQDED